MTDDATTETDAAAKPDAKAPDAAPQSTASQPAVSVTDCPVCARQPTDGFCQYCGYDHNQTIANERTN